MNKQLLTGSGLLMGVALFLAVNIISNAGLKSARLDLTEGKLYTLSQGTRNILQNISEPITLRLFLSESLVTELPGINSYATRVKELLEEYKRIAGNKINLHIIDPEPFSEAEDQAVGFGVQGVSIDTVNTNFYFGLAGTNSIDDEEVIKFFQPNREEFLEYDLTKVVNQLAHPKQKTVGIISTLPIQGGAPQMPFMQQQANNQPWMIVEQLRQTFEVRTIETDAEEIPEDVNVLMVVHPRGLSDSMLYAIDQYVLGGGHAIVFADPYAEAYEPPRDPKNPLSGMNAPRNSEFEKLFETWGVELVPGKVAGDLTVAKRVQTRSGRGMEVVQYPVWMDLSRQHMSQDDIITAKLGDILVASAGILKKRDGAETKFTPIIQTGKQAMQIDTTKLGMFADPKTLMTEFKPAGERFTLAARITGTVKTAFPDGKPAEENEEETETKDSEGEKNKENHLTESKDPVNLIVVADVDLLQDRFWVQVQNFFGQRLAIPHAANATLVTNALDNLSGSNDLISVRNRGGFSRPFTKVEQLQQQAEQRFREKEQDLQAKLKEIEQKIRDLQNAKPGENGAEALILNPELQPELKGFREERLKNRKELRAVQHALRKDIERLESRMQFLNIGFMPLLVGIAGIGFSTFAGRRRRTLKKAE
jgi:ABC-type uncharacterized transport system involved in gliding motility auxiliary subunit